MSKFNLVKEKGIIRVHETGDYFLNNASEETVTRHLVRKGYKVSSIKTINKDD